MFIAYDVLLSDFIIVYTGITSTTLAKRKSGDYGGKMKSAFEKYGREHFRWVEVARFDSGDDEKDRYDAACFEGRRIEELKLVELGLNSKRKGNAHSEEVKQKISTSCKGKVLSAETKIKISNTMKGKIRTKEHRDNLSKSLTGKKLSLETKLKIAESHKHYIWSEKDKIIQLHTSGMSQRQIAKLFGCSRQVVSNILSDAA